MIRSEEQLREDYADGGCAKKGVAVVCVERYGQRWKRRSRSNAGFTLLEVVLASGLSVVVLVVLSMAIHLYLRGSEAGRAEIAEATLARNVLKTIADDLRRSLYVQPLNTSEIEVRAAAAAASKDDQNAGQSQEVKGAQGDDDTLVPGLYGNQYLLQIDVSRLPRIDGYDVPRAAQDSLAADVTSDLKTVVYSVGDMGNSRFSADNGPQAVNTGGLRRRSIDRAVTQWAMEYANDELLRAHEKLLAPEVTQIEFHYYDGSEWALEWDSALRQGLPVAVEVVIHLTDGSVANSSTSELTTTETAANQAESIYRLLVKLPLGRPTSAQDAATENEEAP